MVLSRGDILNGQFEILDEIARGNMGIVYRARQLSLGREVAVKVMNATLQHDSTAAERFRREAEVLRQLRHPNIITIFDMGIANGGDLYFAMELLQGLDLKRLLRQRGPSEDLARWVLHEASKGLQAAHAQGVIHRDLKPGNLYVDLVGRMATLKILDFGIAKLSSSVAVNLTATNGVVGTPAYMSPEQAGGLNTFGAPSDLYSLGVVAYECLTGEIPFTGDQPFSVLLKHIRAPPPPLDPHVAAGRITPDTADIVSRLLQKEPTDRFASAQALCDAVETTGSIRPPSTDARTDDTQVDSTPRDASPAAVTRPTTAAGDTPAPVSRESKIAHVPRRSLKGVAPLVWPALAILSVAALVMGGLMIRPKAPPQSTPAKHKNQASSQRSTKRKTARQATPKRHPPKVAPGTARPTLLLVKSLPEQLTVEVDGTIRGQSPAWIEVKPGPHTVVLLDGRKRVFEKKVTLSAEDVELVDVDLRASAKPKDE